VGVVNSYSLSCIYADYWFRQLFGCRYRIASKIKVLEIPFIASEMNVPERSAFSLQNMLVLR
jgi:hypothetical protein